MLTNKTKQRLREGHLAIGQWISFPSPAIAELVASFGMDWLVIDAEHGPAGWETVEEIVRAMKGTEVRPVVRVPANDAAFIKKALDRGGHGEAIAAVPGVDVLFIGPNDLSASLGIFRQFDNPEYRRAVDHILSAARMHQKVAGIMASSADDALVQIERGFRFVSVGSDTRMLAAATAAAYEKVRNGLLERKRA